MRKLVFYCGLTVSFFLFFCSQSQAQSGFGMRFASHLNKFAEPYEYDLAPGWFSTGEFGVFYRSYNAYGGFELGVNSIYKNGTGRGMPNLPVVMRDFRDSQNVGLTAIETELKVGPRIGVFNPKIGYVLGYRLQSVGFLTKDFGDTVKINRLYFNLPFGASFDFPTNFGHVGVGAYYMIGLLNVRHRTPNWNPSNALTTQYPGGRMNSVNIEITVSFNTRSQGDYYDPEIENADRENRIKRRIGREAYKKRKEEERKKKEAEENGETSE